jgi:predicted metal-dependent hydrolase
MERVTIPGGAFEAEFREGLDLFNAGRFFECHEVWEKLWLDEGDADRAQVLKGLLQAAIALHHFRRHNLEGARKLYEGQKRILAPYSAGALGLDLEAFARAMDASCGVLTLVKPGDAPELDPALVPRLGLRG